MVWGERPLSVEEHERLCDAFLALAGMRDRDNRDLYIDALGGLSFTRHADARHDVWALLGACLAYPSGLRELVVIVRAFHKNSLPMVRLEELIVCMFPEELIESGERERLTSLLTGVDLRYLGNAYRLASPLSARKATFDWSDPDKLVRALESATGEAGEPPPLMVFVDCLAHQLDVGRLACHQWLDEVGHRLGFPQDVMSRLCQRTVTALARAADPYFVVVQLQPDGIDPDRFLLSAWLQQDRESTAEPLHRDDVPRTLAEIADRLSELLREVTVEDVTVEFIVPRGLIGHPIDQWQIDEVLPHSIGTAHPVIVRSLERMRRGDLHGHWRRKWRWLATNGHRHEPDAIRWVRRHSAPDALRSELLVDHLPVAVAMAFPPDDSASLANDEFTAALYAGVPIILWCREPALAEEFERGISALLAERSLAELPQLVLRLRRQAGRSTEQELRLGDHVTLLWDDADRIPESFARSTRLSAPR